VSFHGCLTLFHVATPGGVYLGLFLTKNLCASYGFLSYAFIIAMIVWMLVVWPADRLGRKPLLIVG
jgi:hypothetical protein